MLCFRMGTWGHQQWPLWCSLNDQNEPGRTQWIKWSQRNTGMCWTHWLSRSVTHHIRGFCSPKHLLPLDDAWLAKCIRLRTQNAAARAYGTSLVDFRFRVQPQLNFGGKKKKISSVCPPSRSLRLRVEWINNEVMSKYYGCLLLFIRMLMCPMGAQLSPVLVEHSWPVAPPPLPLSFIQSQLQWKNNISQAMTPWPLWIICLERCEATFYSHHNRYLDIADQ